jgi:hypothetical protein
MKIRQKKLVFIDFSYVFEPFFSIITPRRSIASRRFIRNMIENFENLSSMTFDHRKNSNTVHDHQQKSNQK